MSSLFGRRAALVVLGGGAYTATALLVYNYLTAGQQDQEETIDLLKQQKSFTEDNNYRMERFQKIADTYDEQIGRDEMFMGINVLRRVLLYFHAKGDVLEVGAGTGRNVGLYPKSSVDRVVLTDSSDQMLKQARKKSATEASVKPKYACLQANAGKLVQFPDSSFDTVVDTFGLCSYEDPVEVLREMARVCKPEGRILLLEHGRSKSWNALSQYLDKHAERHAKNWGCVWNRDLDDVLSEAGLQVERHSTWHFGTTYYVVCKPPTEMKKPHLLATSSSISSYRSDLSAIQSPFHSQSTFRQHGSRWGSDIK